MELLTDSISRIFGWNIQLYKYTDIPKNSFGVFISIYRDSMVHGCLGYWDEKYEIVSVPILYTKMINLSYDTAYTDPRNMDHLESDSSTIIEIIFMINPIPLDDKTYNHQTHGIIYENNNNKATFLPDVFKSKSLEYIKSQLINKSNSNSSGTFKSYSIIKFTDTVKNIQIYLYNILNDNYIKFFQKYPQLPYIVSNNKIITDPSQEVRNLSVIITLSILHNNPYKYQKPKSLHALGLWYYLSNDSSTADLLFKNRHELEPIFEYPQICIYLYNSKYKSIIQSEIESTPVPVSSTNIFEINWLIQLYHKYNLINKLIQLKNLLILLIKNLDTLETNYLAVAFEALSVFNWKLGNLYFHVFNHLMKRYNSTYGLYEFLNKDMRVDITDHVISGILIELNLDTLEKI